MKSSVIVRVTLGLVFVVFGLDGLFHFFPLPPMPPDASAVIATLIGYRLFYAVKALEISAGLLLLSNRLVALALCVLAPILFNITWFDAFLDPKSLPVALALVGLEGSLLWTHRHRFAPLVTRTEP